MKGKTMDKFEEIEQLYARRSELNLKICSLENDIAQSNNTTDKLQLLKELRSAHYREFMSEYEIKAVLEPEKISIWNRIIRPQV
jgi:hypothetical protein